MLGLRSYISCLRAASTAFSKRLRASVRMKEQMYLALHTVIGVLNQGPTAQSGTSL